MPIHIAQDLVTRINKFVGDIDPRESETIDCIQSQIDEENVVSADDKGRIYYKLICLCTFISFVLLFSVGMLILTDKRVRGHPNNIIALILMADAYTYFQFLTRYIVCGFELNKELDILFASTV